MKALPLWQPWAQLVVIGAKAVETRSYPAPEWVLGQRIAIHATKTPAHLGLVRTYPFRPYLEGRRGPLPLGAIVGTVEVVRSDRITPSSARGMELSNPDEFAFGAYRPGRYGWTLVEPVEFADPRPFRGRQGIFDVPDELVLW